MIGFFNAHLTTMSSDKEKPNWLECFICQKHTKEKLIHPRHAKGATKTSVAPQFLQFLDRYHEIKKTGKKLTECVAECVYVYVFMSVCE